MTLENLHQSGTISAGILQTNANLSSQGILWWCCLIQSMLKPNRATKGKILTTRAQFRGGIPTTKANFSSQEKLDW